MTRAQLKASRATWARRLAYRRKQVAKGKNVAKWTGLAAHAEAVVKRRDAQIAKTAPPLRVAALQEAERLVGVMEHGGNNQGAQVTAIIRENGGTGPEPWCGDFVAHCYRKAGSKAVQRGWASTGLLGFLGGMKVISQAEAKPGDIVVYNFGSGGAKHTGLKKKTISATVLRAIEGNTGATGAVSDSTTGGDGVYDKERPTWQVIRYVRVTR